MNLYPIIMRKIVYFAVLMLLSAFVSLLQAQVFSDVAPSGQTLYYKITDKTKQQVAVTFPGSYSGAGGRGMYWDGYAKPTGRVVIPSTVTHDGITYTVVSLSGAFHGCDGITSLFLPKTVTDIGVTSFEYCRNLAEISVHPDNPVFDSRGNCNAIISTKENMLVYGCKNATIPNSVTDIAWYAFRGSGLTSITIPSSVKNISNQAFYGCPLTELTIPATVEYLGAGAFMDEYVTATLVGCPLKLEVNKYHFDDEYDEDGFANGVCVVPCGWKKTYENSGWAKYFLFRENCETYDIRIDDDANCGLKTSVQKAKFGDMVQLTCTPGDYDIVIFWGDHKTTIKVENNSFMMPYHEVTVKSVRKSNTGETSGQGGVEALGGKTLQQVLSKVTKNVSYRFPSGGVHIGETGKDGICMQVNADGSMFCGDYYTDEQTLSYRMFIISDPNEYCISNCPGGWAYVGTELNGKKHGDDAIVFDRYGKIIYFGSFRDDKPVDGYPMNVDIPELDSFVLKAVYLSNGDVYLGQMIDGKRMGMGLYIWADGDAWFGGWENNLKNSKGLFMGYDGSYYSGVWQNDKKVE